LDVVMVNPTRVFGPGTIDRKNGYLFLIKNYLYGPLVAYPGFKKQLANMVYLDDVVEGHLLAMEKGKRGHKYLLGGSNVTFDDLFAEMKRITGKSKTTLAIPIAVMDFVAWMQDLKGKWIRRQPSVTRAWMKKTRFSWPVSSQKAIDELGYAPHSYADAIQKTVDWMRAEKEAGRI
jgi:nucleoside-diphosphate-sugar epimerase